MLVPESLVEGVSSDGEMEIHTPWCQLKRFRFQKMDVNVALENAMRY